jgi:hypothetical protein
MNQPHPVFVLLVVALVGTVGLEYGLESTATPAPAEPQLPTTVSDRNNPTPTPSPNLESAAFVVPEPTAQQEPTVRMRVGRVTTCGSTCRDVTAHLRNDGTVDLTNVEVYTTVYAGDEIVWVDAERVGTVTAGERYTTTKRVQVGHGEILKIHANDGSVTVQTVVEFDQGSTVVTEHVDVV